MSDRKSRKIPLDQLRQIAREATLHALKDFDLPEKIRENLGLSVFIEGDDRVFQLYVPGEKPEDAQVISRVTVNCRTGEAGAVEVFLENPCKAQ